MTDTNASASRPATLTSAIMAILDLTRHFSSSFGTIITAIRTTAEQLRGTVQIVDLHNHGAIVAVEAELHNGFGLVATVSFKVEVLSGEASDLRIFRGGFEYRASDRDDQHAMVLRILAQLATADDVDAMMDAA